MFCHKLARLSSRWYCTSGLWKRAITQSEWDSLTKNGFVVCDSVFGEELCTKFKEEIALLHKNDKLQPNFTHLVRKDKLELLQKHSIFETELALESKRNSELVPNLSELFNDTTLLQSCRQYLPYQASKQMIKVQTNQGQGGCFPFHFDTHGKDHRLVTAILYLNPTWQPSDGGKLGLYPFPYANIEVEPINDRLVMFSSLEMLHRVLPANSRRECLTIWIYADSGTMNAPARFRSIENESEQVLELLLQKPYRRHFAKWYYKALWAQSILESHPSSTQTQQAIEQHWNDVAVIEKALSIAIGRTGISLSLEDLAGNLPLQTDRISMNWF
jgi:Rps23 Pro-64 3,4-dihydroxylase Tpa1-like proline 4-hydroxylase